MRVAEQVLEVAACVTHALPFQYWSEEHAGGFVPVDDPEVTHCDPSKYCVDVQAAALPHFSGSGMPKSPLEAVPALGIHMFALCGTFAHACLRESMRAASASARIHERRLLSFHTCSFWPDEGVGDG